MTADIKMPLINLLKLASAPLCVNHSQSRHTVKSVCGKNRAFQRRLESLFAGFGVVRFGERDDSIKINGIPISDRAILRRADQAAVM